MDDRRFDDLARVAAHLPSRRHVMRALLGGIGGLLATAGLPQESAAGRCKKDGGCKPCQTCDRKKKKCVKGCPKGEQCCGGGCVKKNLCCESSEDCNACSQCIEGRCRADTSKNGQQCSGCLTCINGACGSGDDELCEDNERCRQSTGLCCVKCRKGDSCCPVGRACIDPGLLSENSCCDTSVNTPCGDNGDGTYSACCSNFNEQCVAGECVPKSDCTGRGGKAELCCNSDSRVCPGITRPYCAPENQACCGDFTCGEGEDCCDPATNHCCEKGRCLGKACCSSDHVICGDECCDFGEVCCGGVCCNSFDCLNESCCAEGACGDVGASTRVCPTASETCCYTDDSNPEIGNRGYACPPGTPVCSGIGQCCPDGMLYSPSCEACCPSILSCQNCVSPIPGRT
jgi:hypothetical protein